MIEVKVLEKDLNIERVYNHAQADQAGAVTLFIGTVRNKTKSREVVALEYEAYEKMAINEMEKIALTASKKWPVINITIHHRYGNLSVGDKAVVIAVSTPHRKESFEACRYLIDTLKQTVPIWKKEIFEDGGEWVSAHP